MTTGSTSRLRSAARRTTPSVRANSNSLPRPRGCASPQSKTVRTVSTPDDAIWSHAVSCAPSGPVSMPWSYMTPKNPCGTARADAAAGATTSTAASAARTASRRLISLNVVERDLAGVTVVRLRRPIDVLRRDRQLLRGHLHLPVAELVEHRAIHADPGRRRRCQEPDVHELVGVRA